MSDNSVFDPGTGGDTYRSKDRAGVKTEIVGLDIGIGGTETLMTSAALADGTSNPTTAPWAGMLMCFNGTTWDRVRGDTTNGIFANVKALPSTTQAGATVKTFDADTGAGTDTVAGQLIVLPASGGSVVGGTATNPVRTDPTGTTTQPVSGSVTATGPLTDTQLRASAVPVDTELPAAVALADAASNPTAPATGAFGMLWNGSTWDRAPGTAANGAATNLTKIAGTTVDTNSGNKSAGTQRVVLATDQPTMSNAQPVSLASLPSLAGGTNNIGFVTVTPSATGGWSKIKYAAQTTSVVKPKGTAGTFGGYYAYNPNASVAYIQVFDLATATTVTLGTTVPDMIFGIPAGSGANLEIANGVNMALGMQLACTTTATGSTAPSTGLDLTILFK